MKVRVPVLVKDRSVAQYKDIPVFENFTIEDEDIFLDGPVGRRVAVLDFDPKTGQLAPGARFIPPATPEGIGRYECDTGRAFDDRAFCQVAAFGGVHKTLDMFEENDALGRKIRWAFDGPQLLVVPRAGDWANAFYDRDSRSLQFFFFTPDGANAPIYTSQSQDIIAHECAHAIIDGVVPDIYDAASPQSLALHESIADIATVLMAFRSRKLAQRVLEQTNNSIDMSSAFTSVASEFGRALDAAKHGLRELNNPFRMDSAEIDRSEPHDLSMVLSGALWKVMIDMYQEVRAAAPNEPSGRALFIAGERFKRTVIRALDYLPPGEVSFLDFGRAIVASDEASHPESPRQRDALMREFAARGIAPSAAAVDVETNYESPLLHDVDLEALVSSNWSAYRFAEKARELLMIPRDLAFEVRSRLDVRKTYYHRGEEARELRELLFKVSWTDTEKSRVGGGLPSERRVTRGTTLAIDWDKRIVRAVLTTDAAKALADGRDELVAKLLDRDELAIGDAAMAPDGRLRRGVVPAQITEGALRLRSTARTLHLLSESRK
jgi:hypothetical protein